MSNEEEKKILSQNILRLMDLTGNSRVDVCDGTGIKYATLCEWINQRKYPRIDKIEALAKFFGVKKSDIIEDKSTDSASIQTIAAHAATELTDEEAEKLVDYVKFLKSQRNK